MKRFLLLILLVGAMSATAQNVQLHYDFGRHAYKSLNNENKADARAALTSTVEMFRPDKGGSTFFFVDMNYNQGVSGAYWEISRELNFWQNSKMSWLSAHIEYNGGLEIGKPRSTAPGVSYDDAFLFGATYSGHSKDFSKTWSITASYKLIPRNSMTMHNFQITGVWGMTFARGYMSFIGFIDFWREHRAWQNTSYILLAEPQLWFNFNAIKGCEKLNLSIGTEVELSNNFVNKGFYAIPTAAVKWTF